MKYLFLCLLVLAFAPYRLAAQYVAADTLDGVEISYKWASEKWYKPKSDRVLLIQVRNTTSGPVQFAFTVGISRAGKMLESSPSETHTIAARKTRKGRMNGVIFKPASLTREDIERGDFELEIELDRVQPGS